jgi:multiple sugar transport system substrate-binding protein
MSHSKLHQIQIVASVLILVALLLGACAPAATPTQAPAAPTNTTAPEQAQPTNTVEAAKPTETTAPAAPAADTSEVKSKVTLKVYGFKVAPEEIGTPLDKAHQELIANFQKANPNVTVDALEAPPDFDTQILIDLAAGTAADLWYADASTLARLVDSKYLLDMRECTKLIPSMTTDRFFPTVLAIHQRPDGAIYGYPSDFTPMVIYYNPEVFKKANVAEPAAGWTWDDLLKTSQQLTIDKNGKNAADPAFDPKNVVQWGFRMRKYTFEWIYRTWENGSDVISPDGTTAKGYLDSPATIEAITWMRDLVLKYHVSPPPSVLDQLNQAMGFNDRFLEGGVAMFDRGHWELVGLRNSKKFDGNNIMVAVQPKKETNATVLYESGFVIRADLKGDQLLAACKYVDAATSLKYQVEKATTNLAIPANKEAAAQAAAEVGKQGPIYDKIEQTFLNEVPNGRLPYGARYAKWPAVETILDGMMEKILAGGDVKAEVDAAVVEIDRELKQ